LCPHCHAAIPRDVELDIENTDSLPACAALQRCGQESPSITRRTDETAPDWSDTKAWSGRRAIGENIAAGEQEEIQRAGQLICRSSSGTSSDTYMCKWMGRKCRWSRKRRWGKADGRSTSPHAKVSWDVCSPNTWTKKLPHRDPFHHLHRPIETAEEFWNASTEAWKRLERAPKEIVMGDGAE